MSIEREVAELGWSLVRNDNHWPVDYRAEQRKFSTPWRESPELVLSDLREMKRKDAEAEKV